MDRYNDIVKRRADKNKKMGRSSTTLHKVKLREIVTPIISTPHLPTATHSADVKEMKIFLRARRYKVHKHEQKVAEDGGRVGSHRPPEHGTPRKTA
eukprot:4943434-Amphidinium_carterae.1